MLYTTCCVDAEGSDIDAMTVSAAKISYRTMRRRCKDLHEWAAAHNYTNESPLKKDSHVTYHRSEFKGEPCYYLCHSDIEYIWTDVPGSPKDYGYGDNRRARRLQVKLVTVEQAMRI